MLTKGTVKRKGLLYSFAAPFCDTVSFSTAEEKYVFAVFFLVF